MSADRQARFSAIRALWVVLSTNRQTRGAAPAPQHRDTRLGSCMAPLSKTNPKLGAALCSRREILAAGAFGAAALQLPALLVAANGRDANLKGPLPDTLERGL